MACAETLRYNARQQLSKQPHVAQTRRRCRHLSKQARCVSRTAPYALHAYFVPLHPRCAFYASGDATCLPVLRAPMPLSAAWQRRAGIAALAVVADELTRRDFRLLLACGGVAGRRQLRVIVKTERHVGLSAGSFCQPAVLAPHPLAWHHAFSMGCRADSPLLFLAPATVSIRAITA